MGHVQMPNKKSFLAFINTPTLQYSITPSSKARELESDAAYHQS